MRAIPTPTLNMRVTMEIDEGEARFLDALIGYGGKALIDAVKERLGKSYIEPHEADGLRFCETARTELRRVLTQFDEARAVFVFKPRPAPTGDQTE